MAGLFVGLVWPIIGSVSCWFQLSGCAIALWISDATVRCGSLKIVVGIGTDDDEAVCIDFSLSQLR